MFVIVDTDTRCKYTHPKSHKSLYKTEGAAKTAVLSMCKLLLRWGREVPNFKVMDHETYRKQVPMIKVENMMTGQWIEIPADTPRSCRPDSETYWSS